jgi:hypothetical protein
MNETLESFILWSGWMAAVGIAVYEIIRAYHNRTRILVLFTISEKDLCVSVHNQGRHPTNLVEAGLLYANGEGTSYDQSSPEFPLMLFSKDGFNLCFKLKEVIQELKSKKTEIKHGYFIDETGKVYQTSLPDHYKVYIEGLVASAESNGNIKKES